MGHWTIFIEVISFFLFLVLVIEKVIFKSITVFFNYKYQNSLKYKHYTVVIYYEN